MKWTIFMTSLLMASVMVTAIGANLSAQDRATLLVGAASEDITPDTPVMMGGYASRSTPHEGVRSPIFTRILYLRNVNDTESLLWSESDLIGFEPEDTIKIKAILSEKTSVPVERIIISATHNHSGPATAAICSPKESDYLEKFLVPRIVKAAERAIAQAEICRMVVVEGHSELAHDRRNDAIPGDGAAPNQDKAKAVVDYRVPAVAFKRTKAAGDSPADSMKAVLIQYAMHPTSWGDQLIGSEWPGSTANAIRERFGKDVEPFVIQGAAGNLGSPARKAPPEEMARWGRELVASVADQLEKVPPLEVARLAVRTATIPVEFDRFTADEVRQQATDNRKTFAKRPDIIEFTIDPWEKTLLDHLEKGTGFTEDITVTAVALGNHVFVTTPFETFSHLNNFLAKKVNFPVHVIGYTNGVLNYFPSLDAFEQGGYEPNSYLWYRRFPMKRGGLEKLADDLVPLVTRAEEESNL